MKLHEELLCSMGTIVQIEYIYSIYIYIHSIYCSDFYKSNIEMNLFIFGYFGHHLCMHDCTIQCNNTVITLDYSIYCISSAPIMLRKCAHRLAGKLGLRGSAVSKQTRHLPYDAASMAVVRDWVAMMIHEKQIHPKLICHFDQVWTVHNEPAKRVLFKPQESKGVHAKEFANKPSIQKMLESIRAALSLPPMYPSTGEKKSGPKIPNLCAQSTLVPVEYQRQSRTTTTLSFSDGTLGAAYITASSTAMSDA